MSAIDLNLLKTGVAFGVVAASLNTLSRVARKRNFLDLAEKTNWVALAFFAGACLMVSRAFIAVGKIGLAVGGLVGFTVGMPVLLIFFILSAHSRKPQTDAMFTSTALSILMGCSVAGAILGAGVNCILHSTWRVLTYEIRK